MGFFETAHGWGEWGKKAPLPKICYAYPTMMKLSRVITYLKKLRSADISIFSLEIKKKFTLSRKTNMDWILVHNF